MARRYISPFNPAERAVLDPIRQTLYDGDGFGPTTVKQTFFSVPHGQQTNNLGTNITKTRRITNMDSSKQLGNPRLFQAHGIRVHMFPVAPTVSTYNQDAFDITALMFHTYLEFFMGSGDAITRGPTFMFPSNIGIDASPGQTAVVNTQTNTAFLAGFVSVYPSGPYFRYKYNRPLIPPLLSFYVDISAPAAIGALNNNRIVQVLIDGILGRETM